ERIADAEARTLAVLPAAERAGSDVERTVLYALAWARGLRGRQLDEVCERWTAASPAPGHLADSPERIAGQRHVWRGEIDKAEATGFRWDWLESLRARGIAALLAHEPARAAETHATVWEHTTGEGVDDPGVFPVAPDLVEALVELGALDQATAVSSRLRTLS